MACATQRDFLPLISAFRLLQPHTFPKFVANRVSLLGIQKRWQEETVQLFILFYQLSDAVGNIFSSICFTGVYMIHVLQSKEKGTAFSHPFSPPPYLSLQKLLEENSVALVFLGQLFKAAISFPQEL